MTLLNDWQLSIKVDDILRGQGAEPQKVRNGKPRLLEAAMRAGVEGLPMLHPIALMQDFEIKEHEHQSFVLKNGQKFTGKLISRHFSGANQLVAAIVTIGSGIEKAIVELFDSDPLFAMALDGLANAAVENLSQEVCRMIGEIASKEGLNTSTPLSPGSPEWPVEIGQPQIFSLLDGSSAGIKLTPAGMMIPKKSCSFVVGIGNSLSQVSMCEICSLVATCRYQNA